MNDNDFVMPDTQQDVADRSLVVRFSREARLDAAKTAEAGREIYREIEYITILVPGDKLMSPLHRPVQASDRARFPTQYAAFKNQKHQELSGTVLAAWPYITEAQRKELEYMNIRTVEQLADVADSAAQGFHGLQGLKQAAKRFIDSSKETAPLVAMQKELEARDEQAAADRAAISALTARLDALAAPKDKDEKKPAKAAA